MDIEPDRQKLLVTDRVTFDIIATVLSNPPETEKRSIKWLEQAKQSIIYYMRWLYTNDPNILLVSQSAIVPYYSVGSPLYGDKLPITGHDMLDGDETLTLPEIMQLLRLMEATNQDDRDFSENSINRLNYILYLFSRKVDEQNADRIDFVSTDQQERIITEIGSFYKASATVFNIAESEKIYKSKNQFPNRRDGDNSNPIIFIIQFKGPLHVLCFSKKSKTAYYFNRTENFQNILPRLKKTIANYIGGPDDDDNKITFKFIQYPKSFPLAYERYVSFYILFEICKASAIGKNTKQSIRMIAPWLNHLDLSTMVVFRRYVIRTYLFNYYFLPPVSDKIDISDDDDMITDPAIVYDTSGYEDDDDDIVITIVPKTTPQIDDKKNNNNNNNNNNNPKKTTIVIKNKGGKTVEPVIKPPITTPDKTTTGGDDIDIAVIPNTEDDSGNSKKFLAMPDPLESNIIHLANLSDDGKFISESILIDLFKYYFSDKTPSDILLVDPAAWGNLISPPKKSSHKATRAEEKLLHEYQNKSVKTVIIPVFHNSHWSLVIILKDDDTIYYYTSLKTDKYNPKSLVNAFYKDTRNYSYFPLSGPTQACDSLDCAIYVLDAIQFLILEKGDAFDIRKVKPFWTRRSVRQFIVEQIILKLNTGPYIEAFIVDQVKIFRTVRQTESVRKLFLQIMRVIVEDDLLYNFVVSEVNDDDGQVDRKTLEDAMRKLTIAPTTTTTTTPQVPEIPDDNTTIVDDNNDITNIIIDTPQQQQQQHNNIYYETQDPIDYFIAWAVNNMKKNYQPNDDDYKKLENDLIYAGYNNLMIDSITITMKNLFTSSKGYKITIPSTNEKEKNPSIAATLSEASIGKQFEKYRQYKR